jgi:uncharacterized membrane protein
VSTHAANHHEVTLVQLSVDFSMLGAKLEHLIGDRACDSDQLDAELKHDGVNMIAPHRSKRKLKPRMVGICGGINTAGSASASLPGSSGSAAYSFVGSITPPMRYEHGDVRLAIEGDHGMLSEPGKETFTCRNDRRQAIWEHAKLDGVDFRGIGNEPPWVLELREMSRIVLITEYGANRIERSLPQPVNDKTSKMTRWDAGDLQIEITAELCHDTMSGESFDSRVVIHWQRQVLRGCGRPLH